jgi:coniferyl-aldehyde dehydrogenase
LLAPAGEPLRPPLALAHPVEGARLLEEEVFAPVLPVVALADLETALRWIAERPSPLAIYLFSGDRMVERRVLQATRSGALVTNDTVVQAAIAALPFGGVGASGFGRYHGQAGFDTFSNLRAHVRVPRFSLSRLAGPPYRNGTRRLVERLLRW